MFRNLVGWTSIAAILATPGYASVAVTTANVNFRAGPGTSYESFGVIQDGSEVELLDCDASGSWCAVGFQDQSGFVYGKYLQETESEDGLHWPRAYQLEGDAFVVLYQPQFSAFDGLSTLEALVAAEYRASEDAQPVFGVIGLEAGAQRDVEAGSILLHDIRITSLDFTALDREELAPLTLELNELLPTGPVPVAEERIVANLAAFEQPADVEGLSTRPPVIYHSLEPAVLVQTDGPAVFAPVAGADGVEFVLNTNWDLFRVEDLLYLRNEEAWLAAADIAGSWEAAAALPDALKALPDDGNWEAAREALAATPDAAADAPVVFYSDEPAELILFDGQPVLEDVPGTDLEWASNTETDLFRHKSTGAWYVLVSGRWFRTYSREGPFEFASDDLPPDFRFLPEDKPYYTVRASVPGTSEANEARLRAMIPETARVELGSITPEIAYDGEPVFQPIDGTSLRYAVNTSAQVIQVGLSYYLVQDGIWFVSDSPNGPWEVATSVPEVIYEIPPTSPVHNVTYVRVYETEDDAVWTGYTAGYLFGFLAWGTLVYGTGWYYPPYWRYDRRPVYYPRPLSYGGAAYYNPALGTFGRYGYAYGPYRGISARAVWDPTSGAYARGARVYGPHGSRGFVHAYNHRTGTRAVARGGSSIYGRWGSAGVRRGSEYAKIRAAEGAGGTKGVRWDSSRGSGGVVSGRRGNVYAGRDGNVYRRVGDDWQRWDQGSNWNKVQPPRREALRRDGAFNDRTRLNPRSDVPQYRQTGRQDFQSGTTRPRQPRPQSDFNTQRPNRNTDRVRAPTSRRPVDTRPRFNVPDRQRTPTARDRDRARTTPNRVPSHVQHDLRTRQIGNQRSMERRSHNRNARSPARNRPRPARGGRDVPQYRR